MKCSQQGRCGEKDMVIFVRVVEENIMCSDGECKGYEEGLCNYFGVEIPFDTIQLVGKPKDKEHALKLKEKLKTIAEGLREGEKKLMEAKQ
jgi:hypothetical protein